MFINNAPQKNNQIVLFPILKT